MLGPRVVGRDGVSLAPPTVKDHKLSRLWFAQPELSYFGGARGGNWTDAAAEEDFAGAAKNEAQVHWVIQVEGKTVGFTGIEGIDWIRRQGESYIIVGELALQRKGVASEAIRLRTDFAFRELNLHRVYNWIVYDNVGSRRANQKAGYVEQGRIPGGFRRGARAHDVWLGEVLRSDWEKQQST